MDFDDYQSLAGKTDQFSAHGIRGESISLFGLIGEIGSLLTCFKKRIRDKSAYLTFVDDIKTEMGDVLWYLANLASKYNLSLNEIAENNLNKISAMWPDNGLKLETCELYDENFKPEEQLPRSSTYKFTPTTESSVPGIKLRVIETNTEANKSHHQYHSQNENDIGDLITDNSYSDDGYRFHDCFHLSYAAILGWSPVVRWMNKCKRKSDSKKDEIEDGARAILIEELVSQLVHGYAIKHNYFEDINHIDNELITTIQRLVAGLEVRNKSNFEWRVAIFEGYKVFRSLKNNAGGVVEINLTDRTIIYREPDGNTNK